MAKDDLLPVKEEYVDKYLAVNEVFQSLFIEIKDLCKKKPEATLSISKCKIINR